jgi:hypothetical protein
VLRRNASGRQQGGNPIQSCGSERNGNSQAARSFVPRNTVEVRQRLTIEFLFYKRFQGKHGEGILNREQEIMHESIDPRRTNSFHRHLGTDLHIRVTVGLFNLGTAAAGGAQGRGSRRIGLSPSLNPYDFGSK